MRILSAVLALALLGACQSTAEPLPDEECGAVALASWVGGPLPATLPQGRPVRVFAENDAVTMDFNPARLNIVLDAATRRIVVAVRCG